MSGSSKYFINKLKHTTIFFLSLVSLSWSDVTAGTVFDKKTNKPIPGAMVIANGIEYHTDKNGTFHVPSADFIGVRALGYERKFYGSNGKVYLKPIKTKALYLSSFGATSSKIMNNAKNIIHNSEINALVIDIKMDRGQIAYRTYNPVANKIGAQKYILFKDLKQFVSELRKEGIYTIARIVCFKDSSYVAAYPQYGARNSDGSLFKDKESLYWIDPSQKRSWEYIVAIAKESAEAGFDEIQFDYVRFPDKVGIKFSVENTIDQRVKTIGEFLKYARKELTPYNVFISADIFGYVCWNKGDLGIGQKIEEVAKHVDYISPMLYPSGFQAGIPGYRNPVKANYEIVNNSLDNALVKSGDTPLKYRPWLQAFRDYAFDRRDYGAQEIREQIRASNDFGSSGWMLWNPRNIYSFNGLSR